MSPPCPICPHHVPSVPTISTTPTISQPFPTRPHRIPSVPTASPPPRHRPTLLLEDAVLHQLEGDEDGPLLEQGLGVGGHGAGGDAPDVGVVPAAGHEEDRLGDARPEDLGRARR